MELLVLGALAFAAIVVLAVLGSVFGMVMWLVFLPFRVVGWMLRALGVLLALPFVAIFGVIALLALGAGLVMFLVPLLPLALVIAGAIWLVRRNRRAASGATAHSPV